MGRRDRDRSRSRDRDDSRRRRRRRRSSTESSDSSYERRRRRRREKRESGWGSAAPALPDAQVFATDLPREVKLEDLRPVFAVHGEVQSVSLLPGRGHSAIVQFNTPEAARAAFSAGVTLHGQKLHLSMPGSLAGPTLAPAGGGQPLGMGVDTQLLPSSSRIDGDFNISGANARAALLRRLGANKGIPELNTPAVPAMPAALAAPAAAAAQAAKKPSGPVNPLLMGDSPPRKAGGAAATPVKPLPVPQQQQQQQPTPAGYAHTATTVMCILNMVTNPEDADDELAEELRTECSRFGTVVDILLYEEKQKDGSVVVQLFVQFTTAPQAAQAIAVMNGRKFDGRRLHAFPFKESEFTRIKESD